jgi:hypothetical protein
MNRSTFDGRAKQGQGQCHRAARAAVLRFEALRRRNHLGFPPEEKSRAPDPKAGKSAGIPLTRHRAHLLA